MTRSRRPPDTDDLRTIVASAPAYLVDEYRRTGPSRSRSLLESLLTHEDMDIVWQRLRDATHGHSEDEQNVAFQSVLSAIKFASWTYKEYVVPRRTLRNAINRIGVGLRSLGRIMMQDSPLASELQSANNAIRNQKKRWKVPSWLLYECFPDDLAGVLEHYGPHMKTVARQANEKAHTVLSGRRPVDRSGYGWSVFVRILRTKWPQILLKGQDTDDNLARIARAVLPDFDLPDCDLTATQVRDTLRRTSVRR